MKKISVFILLIAAFIGCNNEGDVEVLDSGLKFADDSTGTGKAAEMGDLVSVYFRGWIILDSTDLFKDWTNDSLNAMGLIGESREGDPPIKFVLGSGNFLKGIDEGIVGMKVGGERTIIIPSYLAYGPQGFGPIPPNSNLKIVINLVDAKKPIQVKQWEADTSKAVTTETGLKYIIIKEGTGDSAKAGDVVSVHYSGWYLNGKKFDSSVERDEPYLFTLGIGMVIPGLEEGLKKLREGSKAKLIIPPALAYGATGRGEIPPNSILIFDVELVDVK